MKQEKILCDDCGWTGRIEDLLCADNPFAKDEKIYACPNCKDLSNSIFAACDADGCFEPVSCGMKLKNDEYASLCQKHFITYLDAGKLKL